MKQVEILNFASTLNSGLEKEAGALRFGGKMLGRMAGAAPRLSVAGALGAGRMAGRAAEGFGKGIDWTTEQLIRERHGPGIMNAMKQGWGEGVSGIYPRSTGMMHGPSLPPGGVPQVGNLNAWTARDPMGGQTMRGPGMNTTPPSHQLAAPQPTGAAPGNYYDQFKNYWQSRNTWQKAGLGYGAVTAATTPRTVSNNMHADWQQQHPIQSWMGRTFAGMPEYHRRSYLTPNFL